MQNGRRRTADSFIVYCGEKQRIVYKAAWSDYNALKASLNRVLDGDALGEKDTLEAFRAMLSVSSVMNVVTQWMEKNGDDADLAISAQAMELSADFELR